MAAIQKKGDTYYCEFRFAGKRHHFTIGQVTQEQARGKALAVDELLKLIKRGRVQVPENVPFADFVASDGKVACPVLVAATCTLGQLRDRYLAVHANGTVEANSLETSRSHLSQVVETFGLRFPISSLTLPDLQRHVDRRAKMPGIAGRLLSAATLKKEIASLRACWNWGVQTGLVKGTFPSRGLRYPKEDAKEPFRSYAEIQAIIARDHPGASRLKDLWDGLYLTKDELEELLTHAERFATLPWVYPMLVTAAYTGARRSELLRALVGDFDLDGGTATLREKKRVRGRRSTRTVPLAPKVVEVLRVWLAVKPASPLLFCQAEHVCRSKTKREAPTAITRDEAHDHLKRTLADSKWSIIKGWHCLRHSFISLCVCAGVDQRVIDDFVGHQTEAMRRRYRHLYPEVQRAAIQTVFG